LAGSPAIDAGSCAGTPSLDQRGIPRPAGGSCDIGAYEFAGPSQITLSVDDNTQIQFLVWTNQTYPIQATTNFLSWQTIGTIPASPTGRFVFEDAANSPARFYR